jgi:beta-glucosidase
MRTWSGIAAKLGVSATVMLFAASLSCSSVEQPAVYLDPERPVNERVEDLLGRMTLEEKVGQLNWPCLYVSELGETVEAKQEACRAFTAGTYVPGLGPGGGFFTMANTILHQGPRQQAEYFNELQRIAREQTRLKIPLMQVEEGTHGLMCSGGTIFPEGLALGSTWNMELIERIYSVAASEARAVGIHQLFTLVVEPNIDPRLGRNQEGYGEDPYLLSSIAGAIVRGAQGQGIPGAGKVVAGLCHYPGQSQPVGGLEQGAMEISERRLREVFLPPWESGIKRHGALGVMATYPAIDGVPAHGSQFLLTDILRGEMGFEGLVLSEGDGFKTLVDRRVAAGQKQAGAIALRAGVDIGITYEDAYMLPLIENVREGKVAESDLDRALRRMLRLKFEMGLFEQPYAGPDAAEAVSHAPEHRELALRASREGIVLLRNEGNLLPLSKEIKSIAVIGPNADDARNQLGDYTSDVILQEIVTVLDGIRRKLPDAEVSYVKGVEVVDRGLDEIARAVEAARRAEVAVVVVGENHRFKSPGLGTNGEHKDVASLDLSGRQLELVRAVHATGTPTVVVLINGRPLSTRWIAANVPAVLEPWICGEQGGSAVADVLFGDCNPSGRLPITVPRHVGQLPVYYNYKPSRQLAIDSRGYVDMSAEPLFEFGFGLSYTTFAYSNLVLEHDTIGVHEDLRISVEVANTGGRAGAEVVQLYLRDQLASLERPVRELKGFRKVELKPGETKAVEFILTPYDLSLIDARMQRVVEPGTFEVMVGASCKDIRLRGSFEVVGG